MNILVLTPFWPRQVNPNGIVTYYSNLVPFLRDSGHKVYVATFNRNSSSDVDTYEINYRMSKWENLYCSLVDRFFNGYKQYYLGSRSIVSAIKSIAAQNIIIDIMQMEDSFGWHYYVQKRCPFPVVLRLHGPHFLVNVGKTFGKQHRNRIKREQRSFLAARFVTSPSSNVLSLTKQQYGQKWQLSRVIANSMLPAPEYLRWNLDEVKRNQILFVGRFDNTKGADILLDAILRAFAVIPTIRLIFIGANYSVVRDGKKMQIDEYIKSYNYPNELITYLGVQDKDVIARFRKSSHVTIVSSRYETFGNVVLEAFAYGSPLICSDSGGLPEIVENRKSGLLFRSESDVDLSNKIVSVLEDDQLCRSIADGGYQRVVEFYHPISAAAKLVEFFEETIDKHRTQ
jgi:glycosyltransferase involved in cell wall biosynthesis